eukprot:2649783-Amphidinium_carterae.1
MPGVTAATDAPTTDHIKASFSMEDNNQTTPTTQHCDENPTSPADADEYKTHDGEKCQRPRKIVLKCTCCGLQGAGLAAWLPTYTLRHQGKGCCHSAFLMHHRVPKAPCSVEGQ